MKAEVKTYGGEVAGYYWDEITHERKPYYYVKHWTLHVDGQFICDRSGQPNDEMFLKRIAHEINRAQGE